VSNARSISRRTFLVGGTGLASAMILGGCDKFAATETGKNVLSLGEDANLFVQRLLLTQTKLAPEFSEVEISKVFKANGTEDPPDRTYKALARKKFADYRLEIGGLVERPLKWSLSDIRAMESRTQITRHDCVEGWSCVGKWTGVPLRLLLDRAGLMPNARYIVLHCADTMEGGEADNEESDDGAAQKSQSKANMTKGDKSSTATDDKETDNKQKTPAIRYYETIDLTDAYHPQTILAYDMNGATLPIPHGAPLRLRVERALGYKMAKFVMRLEVVDNFSKFGDGKGGYWEDRGYDWYAGI
jgi:DMSO/TMAO reductase YedYZ molybdopterin-dependent catalytic subunit